MCWCEPGRCTAPDTHPRSRAVIGEVARSASLARVLKHPTETHLSATQVAVHRKHDRTRKGEGQGRQIQDQQVYQSWTAGESSACLVAVCISYFLASGKLVHSIDPSACLLSPLLSRTVQLGSCRWKGAGSHPCCVQFPVGRIARYLRKGRYAQRLAAGAPVYLAAVLEYLTAEVSFLQSSSCLYPYIWGEEHGGCSTA